MAIFSLCNLSLSKVCPALEMYEWTRISSVVIDCLNSWHKVFVLLSLKFRSPFGTVLCAGLCLSGSGQPHLEPPPPLLPPAHVPSTPLTGKGCLWSCLLSGPQPYMVGTLGCSCQGYMVALSPSLSSTPSPFALGWAPWMSPGPGPPFALLGSGSSSTTSSPSLESSQPSLLPGSVGRPSKSPNAYVARILFLGVDPRYWKRN